MQCIAYRIIYGLRDVNVSASSGLTLMIVDSEKMSCHAYLTILHMRGSVYAQGTKLMSSVSPCCVHDYCAKRQIIFISPSRLY